MIGEFQNSCFTERVYSVFFLEPVDSFFDAQTILFLFLHHCHVPALTSFIPLPKKKEEGDGFEWRL